MRVVSWNMKNKKDNWKFMMNQLSPDIALLQEANTSNPKKSKNKLVQLRVKNNVNNIIFSTSSQIHRIEFPKQFNQDFVCVKSSINDKDIYFLSIYGNLDWHKCENELCEKKKDQWFTIFIGQISIIVTHLKRIHHAKHIIIAGDFNCERRMDDNPTSTKFAKRGERINNLFFDSILDLGFRNCVRKFHENPIRTHKHVRSEYPWEIDHMFCTNELYESLISIEVPDRVVIEEISDHNPIIATFKW